MKVVVFGTSEFAVPMLAAVAAAHDVVAVVTQPDRPAGRGQRLVATPVKRAAAALGLRVLTPERLKPFVTEARALGADAFAVASYGKIVPQALLDVVPVAFNVHPSLLPLYRGATPLQSAIRDGRSETGVTIIAMDAGMDTGDVLLQERTPLGARETYGALHDRLAQRGAELLVEALQRYAAGSLARRTQADVARELGVSAAQIGATATRPIGKADTVLADLHAPAASLAAARTADQVVDFVRSLAPAPGARVVNLDALTFSGGSLGVGFALITNAHAAQSPLPPAHDAAPGTLIVERGSWFLRASDGWIAVDELVPAGGKRMTMAAYANGHPVSGPTSFERGPAAASAAPAPASGAPAVAS